jgi:hypothetical protein
MDTDQQLTAAKLLVMKDRVKAIDDANRATSAWIKYDPKSIFVPCFGLWFLWSFRLKRHPAERHHCVGSIFEHEEKLFLSNGTRLWSVPDELEGDLYFAHINPPAD